MFKDTCIYRNWYHSALLAPACNIYIKPKSLYNCIATLLQEVSLAFAAIIPGVAKLTTFYKVTFFLANSCIALLSWLKRIDTPILLFLLLLHVSIFRDSFRVLDCRSGCITIHTPIYTVFFFSCGSVWCMGCLFSAEEEGKEIEKRKRKQ